MKLIEFEQRYEIAEGPEREIAEELEKRKWNLCMKLIEKCMKKHMKKCMRVKEIEEEQNENENYNSTKTLNHDQNQNRRRSRRRRR